MLTRTQAALAIAIFVTAGGLRLWAMSGETIHDWDEAYHAVVARNLAAHPLEPTLYDDEALPHDDNAWTSSRIFLNKPPLALWTMAASIRLFGTAVFAMRLPSALLDLLAVLLTFAIGRQLFGVRVGLGAMALHALLGNALLWVGGVHATDHVDIQLAFWVELAIYGVVRHQAAVHPEQVAFPRSSRAQSRHGRAANGWFRWALWVGAATGAALLTKSAPGALPLLLLLACGGKSLKDNARSTSIAAAVALAIAAPWNLYLRVRWPTLAANAARSQLSHLWQVSENHDGNALFHLEKLGQLHGVLAVIAVGWFLFTAARSKEPGARLVSLWWLTPLVLFSLSATKMPGYMGLASPAVCLMTAAFAVAAFERYRPWVRAVAAAVVVSALVVDVHELGRLGPSTADERAFAAVMRALPPKTVVLGVQPAVQAMFHGAHAAYREHDWPPDLRAEVEQAGYLLRTASCDGGEGLALPPGFCSAQ